MTGTDRLDRAVRAMRIQARTAFVVAGACVAVFGWAMLFYGGEKTFVGIWLLLGVWVALYGGVLTATGRAAAKGSPGGRRLAIGAELFVLLTGWWIWVLFPLTVAGPAYVLALLARSGRGIGERVVPPGSAP